MTSSHNNDTKLVRILKKSCLISAHLLGKDVKKISWLMSNQNSKKGLQMNKEIYYTNLVKEWRGPNTDTIKWQAADAIEDLKSIIAELVEALRRIDDLDECTDKRAYEAKAIAIDALDLINKLYWTNSNTERKANER